MRLTQCTSRTVLAGGLVFSLCALMSAPAAADGEQTTPGAQSIDAVCAGVPPDYEPFTDVDGHLFEDAILCLAYAKVTRGGPGGAPASSYLPQAPVSRDAMASFVARLMDTADRLDSGNAVTSLPPYDGTPAFSDIGGNTHEAAISRLADVGIVTGSAGGAGNDRYVPADQVTRAQMATFLERALRFLLGSPVTTTDDYYTDDSGDVHEPAINAVTSVGIAAGRSAQIYAPRGGVNRGSLAAFLARTLGELEERQAVRPLPPPLRVTPDDTTPGRLALTNPDQLTTDDRTYHVSGLVSGQEYRITVVDANTTSLRADGETAFTRDGDTGLASVGPRRTADISSVNGTAPTNNTGDGTELGATEPGNTGTAVFIAGAGGTGSFVLDLDASGNELVLPVVYRNGGPGNTPDDGGSSPRLEVGPDGVPVEVYDVGGAFRSE